MIKYEPVDDLDPVLLWLDGNTLSVDLGNVYWTSPPLNKVGNVHVIYKYSKLKPPLQ